MRPYIYMSGKIRSMATSSYTRIFGDAAGIIKKRGLKTNYTWTSDARSKYLELQTEEKIGIYDS